MAAESTVLELKNLSKTYILGNRKNAKKAQKAILKLHKKYEKTGTQDKEVERRLREAQKLFSKDKFEDSYKAVVGKTLKPRPKDRGSVVHALTDINLKVTEGELVAIMGPSGSGKSTLLNMLGLLDSPTSGQVMIRGRNVSDIRSGDLPNIRSKDLGFVFQSYNLVPTLTAQENVMLPLKYAGNPHSERKELSEKALERVGLAKRMDHSPTELSGGQQQRVAIARSIVSSPAIIFGDELTGELDSKMTKDVMELVTELNRTGQTFIIVTHNPEVARYCDRVILMKDGRIEKDAHRDQHAHLQLG